MRFSPTTALVGGLVILTVFNVYYFLYKSEPVGSTPTNRDLHSGHEHTIEERDGVKPVEYTGIDINDANSLLIPEPARVYCMVPFLWNKSSVTGGYVEGTMRGRYNEIMRTWGYRCDTIRFFIDPLENTTEVALLPPNVIQLQMRRRYGLTMCGPKTNLKPCKHIWEKVWRMWVWVAEHESHLAEWFVKLDDDSFLFPENLRRYVRLSGMSPSESHYFGNEARHRQVPLILGACVVFSRSLLQISAAVWKQMPHEDSFQTDTCADVNGMTEELTTAVCLNSNLKVHSQGAVWHGREMVLSFQPTYHLWQRRGTDWYWENRPATTGDGPTCCSGYPIAFHNMKATGEHDATYSSLFGFIENRTRVKGKAMLPEYFETVATNLEIIQRPLLVSYGCTTNKNHALALLRVLFPERTFELQMLQCNIGKADGDNTDRLKTASLDALVVVGLVHLKPSLGDIALHNRPPLFVVLLDDNVSHTSMNASVNLLIANDRVYTEHRELVWLTSDRQVAFSETNVAVEAEAMGTMHNLIHAGRRIRQVLIENNTFVKLIGDEVHYK
eukprot:m.41053 g.41053  ORF g.41053 m.41053 type:complete len:556 (-) comp18689_c0_seq1:40-1707(-)